MFLRSLNKIIFIFAILLMVAGCGTQFTCSDEVAAPPEREFWCSPISKVGKIFFVQKNYRDNEKNNKETVKKSVCEDTIGEKECNEKE